MKYLHRLLLAASVAFFIAGSASAQTGGTVSNHAFAIGKGAGTTGYTSVLCGSSQLAVPQTAADPVCQTIIPFTPVVSPVGPGASGHVLPWLDENWLQSADTYTIQSSDAHVLPVTTTLSGTVTLTFTMRLQWGANDISKTSSVGGSLAAVAADLTTKLQADATITAAGINIQNFGAVILLAPQASNTLTVSSTGTGTITVAGSPSANNLDVNPIIGLTRNIAGRAANTNDSLGAIYFYGQDSTGALNTSYGSITGYVGSPAAGAQSGIMYLQTAQASTSGSNQVRWAIGCGLYAFTAGGAIPGGDTGCGNINTLGLLVGANNAQIKQSNASAATSLTLTNSSNHSTSFQMYGASMAGGERAAITAGGTEALTFNTGGAGGVAVTQGALTSASLIGGTAASSGLTLESTSGAGTSDSIIFKTGSQATRWTIDTNGLLSSSFSNSNANAAGISLTQTLAGGNAAKISMANDVRSFSFFVAGAASGVDPGGVFSIYDNTTGGGAGYRLFVNSTGQVGIGPSAYQVSRDLGMDGTIARNWGLERNTTANTAGVNLTLNASGATSGATNKAGGNLALNAGVSTGSGTSDVVLSAYPGVAGATADNALVEGLRVVGSTNLVKAASGYALASLAFSATAPTVSSGFCTSPSISNNNGTAAFTITIGSACAGSVGVLTMPAAAHGWTCDFHNLTNPAANKPDEIASTATSVSVTNYVRTTGVAGNFTASDVVAAQCTAY